ncbi:MAG: LysR family transcriptional regulator [Oscillatoriales cyanobacterium SM2_2_1]|nr:LysR family transcriptional regulator [Oscillatoriales cyanobacterium SM2_2_1]
MDRLTQIRAFTQVVMAGGFAAAARQMGVSRSVVNKLVLALEQDLGVQLLHRSTRVVTPTELGLTFYDHGLEVLERWTVAEQQMRRLQDRPSGRLRVNGPMTFGTMFLAPAIAEFLTQYPDLQIQLTLNDRLIDPIEEGFDITLRIAAPLPTGSLYVQPLRSMPLWVCAAPTYLERHGTPRQPQDLRSHPCLHYGHLSTPSRWTLAGETVSVQGGICSNNGEVLLAACLRGLGIALLPEFLVGGAIASGELQRILTTYPAQPLAMELLYSANPYISQKTRLLLHFLSERFGEQGPDFR